MHFTVPTQPLSPLARRPKIGPRPTSPSYITIDSDSDHDSLDDLDPEKDTTNSRHSQSRLQAHPQSRYQTQATQIVDRPVLKAAPAALSSSPRSSSSHAVEVPASSPFQSQPVRPPMAGRLGSAMAPRGTAFRPPSNNLFRSKQVLGKRTSSTPDIVDNSSDPSDDDAVAVIDSSGDERPPRGDIRPTSFQRTEGKQSPLRASASSSGGPSSPIESIPVAATDLVVKGSIQDKRLTRLISVGPTCLSKMVPGRATVDYQRALVSCNYNKEEAALMLRDSQASKKARHDELRQTASKAQATAALRKKEEIRSFIRSFEHKPSHAQAVKPLPSPETEEQDSDAASDFSSVIVVTPVSKPKGRLQRGLKPRDSPSSVPKPVPETIMIDSDNDEEFSSASEEEDDTAKLDKATRILKYLNECTLGGLLAISGSSKYKKDFAEAVIANRPFSSLEAVRRVTLKKAIRKQGQDLKKPANEQANVGEQIIDNVSRYIKALDAIDDVVAKCDAEGTRMKAITDRWNMDSRGNPVSEQARDGQMTPSSADGHPLKVVELPIPREPELMRGHCSMKPYQLYGLNWLNQLYQDNFGCILADDMGLGKTCQIISLIAHIVETYDESSDKPRPWPNLIVVPPSTFSNWETEFNKFAPDILVTRYHGKPAERDELARDIRENPEEHHVVLTTYTQLGRSEDLSAMFRIRPNAAIFDEGHKVKNSKTNTFQGLSRITAQWRVLLTGTPIQNNIMEMINLLSFIQPDLFQTRVEMLKDVFEQKVSLLEVSNGALLFSDRIRRARSILEPFILQRLKDQTLIGLPPKTSRVVYCDMDAAQRKIYDGYRSQFRKSKDSEAPRKAASADIAKDKNNVWIQLRKSAIHSQLFRRFFTDAKVEEMAKIMMDCIPQDRLQQPKIHHLITELQESSDFQLHLWCRDERCISRFDVEPDSWMQSGKVQALLELLKEFRRNGDRALVFTRFATMIEILSESLASAGIPHLSLQGSTKVDERQDLIDEFNDAADAGEGDEGELTAFLLTTGAGGTGINLATANKVIIFDQSDNPQDDAQAESRAHRLGQTRPVEVIRLITRDSVEELIYKACQKKLELADRVTNAAQQNQQNKKQHQLPTSAEDFSRAIEEEVQRQILAGDE